MMCYFVIAVKRGKKRDRAGVEQRPPPPPPFSQSMQHLANFRNLSGVK